MQATFDFTFDWNPATERGKIVQEYIITPFKDHEGKPYRGTSVLREELSNNGWVDFLSDLTPVRRGRYRCVGYFWWTQDYWGEWDEEIVILSLRAVRRRICVK